MNLIYSQSQHQSELCNGVLEANDPQMFKPDQFRSLAEWSWMNPKIVVCGPTNCNAVASHAAWLRDQHLPETTYTSFDGTTRGVFVLQPHTTLGGVFERQEHFTDFIPDDVKHGVREKRVLIVFYYATEGEDLTAYIDKFVGSMSKYNLPLSQFVFISGSRLAKKKNDRHLSKHGTITTLFCNIFHDNMAWTYSTFPYGNKDDVATLDDIDASPIPNWTFLLYNRITKSHRLALLAKLYEAGILHTGLWSNGWMSYHNDEDELRWVVEATESKFGVQVPEALKKRRVLDTDQFSEQLASSRATKSDFKWVYLSTWFSIVSESVMESGIDEGQGMLFLTEKTFKPIANHHPFIIVGNYGSLLLLRSFGYKTFAPYINEDYDLIQDDKQRLEAIVQEVERLCKWTTEDWCIVHEKLKPILVHNHEVLVKREPGLSIKTTYKELEQLCQCTTGTDESFTSQHRPLS